MNHRSGKNNNTRSLDLQSGGFIEAMWETSMALAMAAAICVSLISLSTHLNKAKTFRESGARSMQSTAEHRRPSVANIDTTEATSHFN